jgi:hypothetical protein
MLAYREHGRAESGDRLKHELLRVLDRVECDSTGDCALEALLRAGELECALADVQHPGAERVARVTDAMAARMLPGYSRAPEVTRELPLEQLDVPARLRATSPAGFARDALNPLAYAQLVERLGPLHACVAVIGVRSIGTSLGAIVRETLRARGVVAARISVRPVGLPCARTLTWSEYERRFVECARDAGALFIIVDEGPGSSGSTFLAVAEALEALSVPSERIALFCGRQQHPARLTAPNAAARWARYRSYAPAENDSLRAEPERDLSAGAWRRRVFGSNQCSWPASWTQLERIKRLSPDGQCVDKFEGLPPYCEAALARAWALEQAGFGPALHRVRRGFARFEWLDGRAAQSGDLDPHVIAELARYCAFRLRTFAVRDADPAPIEHMLRVNIEETFGLDVRDAFPIAIDAALVPDARMQPHEWCFSRRGRLMKLDGHGHGDGHLLPGPTDVCWDLAGAIIEWDMDQAQQDTFVCQFERLAGARVHSRLTGFLVAYAALRVGEMSLALASAQYAEIERIAFERARYGRRLERLLQARGLLSS